jgi:putative heme iron utilization protein
MAAQARLAPAVIAAIAEVRVIPDSINRNHPGKNGDGHQQDSLHAQQPKRNRHADGRVSILRGAVFPAIDGTDSDQEREMGKIAAVSEPASELERLIAELSGSGLLVFVFGVGWWTAHLTGATTALFRGPADRRWWHVELGDDTASWTMDVRVDEITGVRFVREPYPFPSFPGREVLIVQFLGPGGETVLNCYVHDLYDGQQMCPEKLAAWRALRERYGNRDESRVDRGTLLAPAA